MASAWQVSACTPDAWVPNKLAWDGMNRKSGGFEEWYDKGSETTEAEPEPVPFADSEVRSMPESPTCPAESMLPAGLLDDIGLDMREGSIKPTKSLMAGGDGQPVDVSTTVNMLSSVLGKNAALHYEADGRIISVTGGNDFASAKASGHYPPTALPTQHAQPLQAHHAPPLQAQHAQPLQAHHAPPLQAHHAPPLQAHHAPPLQAQHAPPLQAQPLQALPPQHMQQPATQGWQEMGYAQDQESMYGGYGYYPTEYGDGVQYQEQVDAMYAPTAQPSCTGAWAADAAQTGTLTQPMPGRFCVFCGKPKHSLAQRFCSHCGEMVVA